MLLLHVRSSLNVAQGISFFKIAEEYDLDLSGLGDKRRKENVRDAVKIA